MDTLAKAPSPSRQVGTLPRTPNEARLLERGGKRSATPLWISERRQLEPPKTRTRDVPWPHAPVHRLSAKGTYFLTAGTFQKEHFFRGANRVRVLHRGLLTVAQQFGWNLEAWAVFSNHYHFVAHSPPADDNAESFSQMLGLLHEKTAKWINKLDNCTGRQLWHNFWETRLTYEKSYLARLNYVPQNPVKHGLVAVANRYPWCSAGWFERTAKPAQIKTIIGSS